MASGKSLELQNIPKPVRVLVWPSSQLGTFSPRKPQYMTKAGQNHFNLIMDYIHHTGVQS